ncbi:MAG: GNAT family N-acetyltransferase [Actinocatenispora sp.]
MTSLIELRWPSLEDLDELASCGAEGVHDPEYMPFFSRWTDGEDSQVAHRVMQRHWSALGAWKPDDWTLYLAVVHEGRVVGSQSIGGRDFAVNREVVLTSWLGRRFQGQGIGGHARAAAMHLAFEGLQAEHALTVVMRDNQPSQGVCRKFGFVHDGIQHNQVRGRRIVSDRWRLNREQFHENNVIPVKLDGVEPALEMFGLAGGTGQPATSGPALPPTANALAGVQFAAESDSPED